MGPGRSVSHSTVRLPVCGLDSHGNVPVSFSPIAL
uniref:Uncharacterized protein n=1 Tax=Anguilla anguilla TaxID=7936 RepID=A0A0E9VVN3_ANGAN